MTCKYFKTGLVIGRFQPLHKGHQMLIEAALDSCDRVVVLIGSSQAFGTRENPLSSSDRYRMIASCFSKEYEEGRLLILPIADRENYSDDSSFGEYVYAHIRNAFGIQPDCVIEGKESVRKDWWASMPHRGHIEVSRDGLEVSGTALRHAILTDDQEYIDTYSATNTKEFHSKIKEVMKRYENQN